jgi:hypothetical protein
MVDPLYRWCDDIVYRFYVEGRRTKGKEDG